MLAGCGSGHAPVAGSGGSASAASPLGASLATSLAGPDGTSWTVLPLGRTSGGADRFWELFIRPAGSAGWKLATPDGVATNGGLVVARAGPGTLVTGVRPSQKLTFSPVASSADSGSQWTQYNPLSPGLADMPDALAGSADGRLMALTDAGTVEIGTGPGATWTRLTTLSALATSPAARRCGLTALTAVAWTPSGAPLVAGACRTPDSTGIFTLTAGRWQAVGPALRGRPAAPARIVGLSTTGSRTTAVLTVGAGAAAAVVAAWSADGGGHWTLSPPLRTPGPTASAEASVSFRADGTAGLVLTPADHGAAGQEATIGWQASNWNTLPPLRAGVVTLTASAAGTTQAMAVSGGTLTVWQLAAGGWSLQQTVRVTIPYGSSG
jgi:hypothetical protein